MCARCSFSAPNSELELLHEALGGADQESLVSSGTDSGKEKDFVKGLAQRATDPYIKERKTKGPFVVSMQRPQLGGVGEGRERGAPAGFAVHADGCPACTLYRHARFFKAESVEAKRALHAHLSWA